MPRKDNLVNASQYGWTIQYFDETDPAFDVEYSNGEFLIRILGEGDYDDYSVSITKGDYNYDASNFLKIADANKYISDFMKEHSKPKEKMKTGGSTYMSGEDYYNKLSEYSDEQLLKEYCYEYGLDATDPDNKYRIENEREEVINELVSDYVRMMKSTGRFYDKGEIGRAHV